MNPTTAAILNGKLSLAQLIVAISVIAAVTVLSLENTVSGDAAIGAITGVSAFVLGSRASKEGGEAGAKIANEANQGK